MIRNAQSDCTQLTVCIMLYVLEILTSILSAGEENGTQLSG